MPHYMLQVGYTPEAWASMVKNPQDRIKAVTPAVEKLGGKVLAGYLTFGEYDLIAIVEMKSNVDAASFAIAVAAAGAVSKIHTTVLMTTTDGIEAMKRAGTSTYRPATKSRARAR